MARNQEVGMDFFCQPKGGSIVRGPCIAVGLEDFLQGLLHGG